MANENRKKRCFELLPLPHPKDYDPGPKYFYDNFAKPLLKDFTRIMVTGINIDPVAVKELENEVDTVLTKVDETLGKNKIIQQYQSLRKKKVQKDYEEECLKSIRTIDYYLKPYNPKDIIHRTWVVNSLISAEEQKEKWTVADLKKFNIFKKDSTLSLIIDGKDIGSRADAGMKALAEYKLSLWNTPRVEKSKKPAPMDSFNPGSAQQKQGLFEMLNLEAVDKSDKTGKDSWNRKNIEILMEINSDPDLAEVLEAFVDHSFSAIIRNNFLAAFDKFTVNGVLHGNIKLFGAKTFRPTSNSPNLLNMPSSKSSYAKKLKRCFKAKDGKVIYAVDLSALEDRVIANLTDDTNKKNVFLEGLDGHSLNACGYYPDEIKKVMGEVNNFVEYVKEFKNLVDLGNEVLDTLRFRSKAVTFKLAYGGYPDVSKGGVITQELFDNYHNVLYPGITDYRENYVLPTAKENGYLHLGLGCRIYTSDAGTDIRTLHNATVQFWSILTLIAVNEINYRIDEAGLQDCIEVCSTIYDSIYFVADEDPEVIKWLNDNIIPILCVQYLEDEPIRNSAEGEISKSFTDMVKISNNASIEEIKKAVDEVSSRK